MWIKEAFRIGRVQYGPGSGLGPRASIGFEFVRCLKGQITWHFNNETHHLGPGALLLSQPNATEEYHWDTQSFTQHDFIHFYLHDDPQIPDPATWPRTAQLDANNILHGLFQHIIDLNRSNHPQAPALIKNSLNHILQSWVFGLHQFEDRGFKDFSEPIQRCLDLVHGRWRQQHFRPPGLDIMTQASGVSRSSLIRAFKQEFGLSPAKFFEQQCLLFGRLLLLESERSIESIAEHLGYQNPFHLSKNFKLLFGMSPRQYRKQPQAPDIKQFNIKHVFELLAATQTI